MLSEVGRPASPGQRIMDVLDTVLHGRQVSDQQINAAVTEAFSWVMGGNVAPGYYPDAGGPARPEDYRPPRPGHQHARRPAPDPAELELQQKRARARQTLEFAVNQVLTKDEIVERRKQLARKWHPDRHPEGAKRKAADDRMKAIGEAVMILLEEIDER